MNRFFCNKISTPAKAEIGCDMRSAPKHIKLYPDVEKLKVGEAVIMYCRVPPVNSKMVECEEDNFITMDG